MSSATAKFVASILVADRPGIMRAITSAITDLGGNINGVRQTVVEGYFSIILTATFPETMTGDAVDKAIANNFDPGEASIVVRPCDPVPPEDRIRNGHRFILVIAGEDKPGVLKAATGCLADHGINIEDWSYYFEGTSVTYIGDLTVPHDVQVHVVQQDMRTQLAPLAMQCSIHHENIFRATSELGPVKNILEGRHAS